MTNQNGFTIMEAILAMAGAIVFGLVVWVFVGLGRWIWSLV